MLKDTKTILQKYWGHNSFRGSQEDIIDTVISGHDVLALMPTGGGKSICYQVPGLMLPGICIVVSPLVALIQDQVRQLKEKGIKAIALTGGIPFSELNDLLDNCIYGNYQFLYLSPERLQQEIVQNRIHEMNINLIAIDEAHCISQWGNDFRPAYLECAVLRELAPGAPIIALTATATPRVVDDVLENLQMNQAQIYKDSFSRDNISFRVKKTEDQNYQLKRILEQVSGSSIVYVRSRKMTISLSAFLHKFGVSSTFFHGGIPKEEKTKKLNQWLSGEVQCIVATNAFGMGVDKANVRCVVHYQIPDSLESYFQEAGRAGRDGETAEAVLIVNQEDASRAEQQFIASLPDVPFVKDLYLKLNNYFQISFGESISEPLVFKFNNFCDRYGLNPNLTYNGLRILDQNSILSLSENFSEKVSLQFVASRNGIFQYLSANESDAPIIQTILRTYGGITDYDTKINLGLIAKKTGKPELVIKKVLERLQLDGVANYECVESDLEIQFLVPREDDRAINPIAANIQELNKVKQDNLAAMLAYVNNTKRCRSNFILSYFGESPKNDCGTCDICIKDHSNPTKKLKELILDTLRAEPMSSRQLENELTITAGPLLASLKELLEEERIRMNSKNEYEIDN